MQSLVRALVRRRDPDRGLELVERILKLMNSDLEPIVLNQASHEIRHQYLSAEKARRMLDWHPRSNEESIRTDSELTTSELRPSSVPSFRRTPRFDVSTMA